MVQACSRLENSTANERPIWATPGQVPEAETGDVGTVPGGFLTDTDAILQPFSLPRPVIKITDTTPFVSSEAKGASPRGEKAESTTTTTTAAATSGDAYVFGEDIYHDVVTEKDFPPEGSLTPMTMQRLAKVAADSGSNSDGPVNADNLARGHQVRQGVRAAGRVSGMTKRARSTQQPSVTARVLRPRSATSEAEKRHQLEVERAIQEAMEE